MFDSMTFLAAALPSLDGIKNWFTDQASTAILLVVIAAVVFFLIKQSWGRLLGVVVLGGIVFFVVGSPKKTMNMIGDGIDKIVNGLIHFHSFM